MARLSCECLNIVLHIRGDRQPVKASSLQLPPKAQAIPFFKENISEVQLDLGGISKEQKCLIQERSAGDWLICKCSNCDTWCYAFQTVKKLNRVLVNNKLLSDVAKQEALRATDDYSPLFGIILTEKVTIKPKEHSLGNGRKGYPTAMQVFINPPATNVQGDLKTCFKFTPITGNEDAVRNNAAQLQDQLTKYLTKEKTNVDERIRPCLDTLNRLLIHTYKGKTVLWSDVCCKFCRKYAEEQKAMFASLQRRAYKDKNIMIGKILDVEEHQLEESLSEAMLDSAESDEEDGDPQRKTSVIRRPFGNQTSANNQVVPEVTGGQQIGTRSVGVVNVRTLPDSQKLDRRVPSKKSSNDADPLFDLDDLDKDSEKPFFESDDESSTDDNSLKEESPLSRQQYAASVPISMPVWPKDRFPAESKVYEDDDPETLSPMPEPDRMVESMRALSMSVQDGTEMFGDLPRPRLNTGDFSRKKGPPI